MRLCAAAAAAAIALAYVYLSGRFFFFLTAVYYLHWPRLVVAACVLRGDLQHHLHRTNDFHDDYCACT